MPTDWFIWILLCLPTGSTTLLSACADPLCFSYLAIKYSFCYVCFLSPSSWYWYRNKVDWKGLQVRLYYFDRFWYCIHPPRTLRMRIGDLLLSVQSVSSLSLSFFCSFFFFANTTTTITTTTLLSIHTLRALSVSFTSSTTIPKSSPEWWT